MISRKAFTVMFLLVAVCCSPAVAADTLVMNIDPAAIPIGATYDGSTVRVFGEAPEDCDVVIRMVGETHDLTMKQKGKVFGLLWMNLNTLKMHNVPSFFYVDASRPFEEAAPCDPAPHGLSDMLGMKSLGRIIQIEPKTAEDGLLFQELLKLKEHEKLYRQLSNVRFGTAENGKKSFEANIDLPPNLSAGQYKVEAYAVRNGQIAAHADTQLGVSFAGFPKLLANVAFQHALIYGLMSVIIALVAGLLTGLVFGGGKGAH
ncbi:TIGR02186 family protein [Desulfatirhabdium butyrativorans]|uniref:TIGR02186 family protein n=1 Tax=Desulfatirhabdium butyrativorans TaxID=340467 RepID=UPI00042252BD|nr:TIGR02186 family protein [Desulfatirhabdium butyrativorans]